MTEGFNTKLGANIRILRDGVMTQKALANRVGLSRTSITNIECGRQGLLVHQLVDIADALDVPVAKLIPSKNQDANADVADTREAAEMPTVLNWVDEVKRRAVG